MNIHMISVLKPVTSAPIVAWKYNIRVWNENMTDRPTRRPINQPADGYEGSRVSYTSKTSKVGILGQKYRLKLCVDKHKSISREDA